jgi:hypothetical protein
LATFQDLKDKIEALSDDDFEVGIAEKSPPSEAQLVELEARIGRPFEPELRAFLLGWGLLIVEVKETAWPRPKGLEALQAWRKQHGFTVLGAGGDLPPELQIEAALTPELLERRVVPLIRRFGAKSQTVITDEGMAIATPDGADLEPLELDAIGCMLEEIAALEKGILELRAAAEASAS